MGDIKKAIISAICIGVVIVLYKMGLLHNPIILAVVAVILCTIVYIFYLRD